MRGAQIITAASMKPATRLGAPAMPQRPALASRRTSLQKHLVPRAAADSASGGEQDNKFALAPSKPKTPTGEMAAYYLEMQPHLFQDAVQTAFSRIKEQREAEAAAAQAQEEADKKAKEAAAAAGDAPGVGAGAELTLYRRMAEVKAMERLVAIEDLMYVCILEKFKGIGVDMLPRVEPIEESSATLQALTEGVHSREAIDMVKEHVLAVLGPASMAFSNTMIKMSKLQGAQVYAASIMFGYFLRRVDTRFRLAKQLGVLPQDRDDAVARLERLFSEADALEEASDPDSAPPLEPTTPKASEGQQPSTSGASSSSSSSSSSSGASSSAGSGGPAEAASALTKRPKSALRKYVESFDQETMLETARLVTVESAALTERQTQALYGDIKALQADMQSAVGQDASSMEEIMQRVQQAVTDGRVETVVMTVGTQRRAVLEAIAYGCFLRDVESWVDTEYELLTPVGAAGASRDD
ncbi:hypothetical protein D9Q98_006317 [Chlorella vulgaris]|uniref:Uncharacterized protein n=1 Tax=Chlorella vulgaris TaxID=3077 RepID=A0A9D4TK32_CHLVU|nr:hypothetical protein D9Q98_006317 [Chlorella vulgaris]